MRRIFAFSPGDPWARPGGPDRADLIVGQSNLGAGFNVAVARVDIRNGFADPAWTQGRVGPSLGRGTRLALIVALTKLQSSGSGGH